MKNGAKMEKISGKNLKKEKKREESVKVSTHEVEFYMNSKF